MRRLYLLRHAKSSWDDPSLDDHDRPLAPRGRRAAGLIAEHLKREGLAPALVLCSTARRARETIEPITEILPKGSKVRFDRTVYAADAGTLLERLRRAPVAASSVMLVGHNPGMQDLALELARPGSLRDRVEAKFPTGALAALDVDVPTWKELSVGGAEIRAYWVPADLRPD